MSSNPIQITTTVDLSGIQKFTAGAKEAGAAAAEMAQKFMQSGLSAQEATDALINLGYAQTEAAAAAGLLATASVETSNAMSGFERAAAMAGARVVGMETGMGALGYQIGRVASYVPGLGLAFAGAFAVTLPIILAEKIYEVYQNVVLLKGAIEALNKAGEEQGTRAATLNYEYELSAARIAEQNNKFEVARSLYEKAAADKPIELPKIDDKMFKQFSAEFVTFMQAAHASSEAPTVLTTIKEEASSVVSQIAAVKEHLAAIATENSGVSPIGSFIAGEHAQAQLQDLETKLRLLQTIEGEIQSQSGSNADRLAEEINAVGEAAQRSAKASAKSIADMWKEVDEAQKTQAREELETLERNEAAVKDYNAGIDKAMEESLKWRRDQLTEEIRFEGEAYREGVRLQEEADRKSAEASRQLLEQETAVFRKLDAAAREVAEKEKREFEQATRKIAQDFSNAVNQVITGHEKIGQAALKLGQELEMYIIDEGIKAIAVKYGTELLTMLAAHSAFLANLFGIQTASDAESIAQAKLLQEQIVMAQAGEAFAAGFASTMAALPFPVNVATAPAVAAAAMAQTLAGGQFEYGGVVPYDMGALVHAGERVLTPVQNQNFERIANNSHSSASHISMENHFHKTSDLSESNIARTVKRAVRRGLISPRSLA